MNYHYSHSPSDGVGQALERLRVFLQGERFPDNADANPKAYEKHAASLKSEGLR